MRESKKKIVIDTILLILIVLNMAIIFYFSSQVATDSNELSEGMTSIIIDIIEKILIQSNLDVNIINSLIRKSAHFFIYSVLGFLTISLTRRRGEGELKGTLIALGICTLYATSDEFHQTFVPGRSGEIRDVVIDSAGAIFGITIHDLAVFCFKRKCKDAKKD